eukprot:TRINITY_DN1915_c0_g1_i11.p1 TRINITY_DN1915_c0_g1~~TRINITY_DN1915_c0_g1_i11.p1  ORF type:complete len:135 (+),score=26.39 TRINITY_DN1915_c0_g1_i11:712-1116(+)
MCDLLPFLPPCFVLLTPFTSTKTKKYFSSPPLYKNEKKQVLAPGGYIFFRDYGRGDLAEIRFSSGGSKKLSENFYVRKDGTRAYYFDLEDLTEIFIPEKYHVKQNQFISKQVENKKKESKMNRKWIQTKIQKLN